MLLYEAAKVSPPVMTDSDARPKMPKKHDGLGETAHRRGASSRESEAESGGSDLVGYTVYFTVHLFSFIISN